MSRLDTKVLIPPRLLAGATVLFWGGMTENALLGFVFALLLEGKNWIKTRWDFGEAGHVKAFQVSLLLLLVGLALIWMDGAGRYGLLKVMEWMPLYGLPVELAQRYGRQNSMYLNTFFYFSRQRMIQDRKEGREVDPTRMNTGYLYIGLVLLSTACVSSSSWVYMSGLLLLMLIVFISVSHKRGMSVWSILWVTPLMVLMGVCFQWGLITVNNYLRNPQSQFDHGLDGSGGTMSASHSRMGSLGKIKQSKEVMWRIWTDQNPSYLRIASFDTYWNDVWTYNYRLDGYRDLVQSFEREASISVGSGKNLVQVFREEDQGRGGQLDPRHAARIRGTIEDTSSTAIIPSVPGYYGVSRILGEEVSSDNNPMGALRLINRGVIIDYMLWSDAGNVVQDAAPRARDVMVDLRLEPLIEKIAKELKLESYQTPQERVEALRRYFNEEFEYATHFDANYDYSGKSELEVFLTEAKKGHCEYFASAATLLLRQTGVPARYTVGFAVMEKDDDVWLVRGTHGHAWCRVYMDGKWQDVDLTPPGWFAMDDAQASMSLGERFQAWVKLVREDFQVWRQDEANRGKFWLIVSGLGSLLGGWVVFRLWRSRLSAQEVKNYDVWHGERVDTPLHHLERMAEKVLGERPVGMPYGRWIRGLEAVDGVSAAELDQAVALHQRLRFDPGATEGGDELSALVEKVKPMIKKAPRMP